jgi:hypothetical protein
MTVAVHQLFAWHQQGEAAYGTPSGTVAPSAGSVVFTGGKLAFAALFAGAPALKTIRWACGRGLYVDSFGAAEGDEELAAAVAYSVVANFNLYAVRQTSTTYKLRLKQQVGGSENVIGTTPSTFTFGSANKYFWRLTTDGSRVALEVGVSTLSFEINEPSSDKFIHLAQLGGSGSFNCGSDEVAFASGDSDADRPDPTTLDGRALTLDSPAPTYDDYTLVVPPGSKTANIDDWDAGDSTGDTDYIESPATINTRFRQSFHTVTQTLSNIRAVSILEDSRLTVADKTVTFGLFVRSTGGDSATATLPKVGTTYTRTRAIFNDAPGSSGWAQSELDALQVAADVTIGPDAVAHRITAFASEVIAFTLEPGGPPSGQPFHLREDARIPALSPSNEFAR